MTIVSDIAFAVSDELARRRALTQAKAAAIPDSVTSQRCAHCAHCTHCEECPFRLDLHSASKPLARLVLERIDKYYVLMGILPVLFVMVAKEAAVKSVTVTCLIMAALALIFSLLLKAVGVQKVWPKSLDVFNLLLFAALLPPVMLQSQTMATWLGVVVNAATCLFAAATVIVRRPYILDIARDHIPKSAWGEPRLVRPASAASLAVAVALLIATGAALVPAFMCPRARWKHAEEEDECPRWAMITFDYVLQIIPLIGALIVADVIAHRTKVHHTYQALFESATGGGGGAGGGGGGAGTGGAAGDSKVVAAPHKEVV